MTTVQITQTAVRVPANTYGHDREFKEAGFAFVINPGDDAIYRAAYLPKGWRARGLVELRPLEIVDQHTRIRVVIRYGTKAHLDRLGRTVEEATARMRMVSLHEYLARCIATGEPVIPDDAWAVPAEIWKTASVEAARATRTAAEFALRQQENHRHRYEACADAWNKLAAQYAPTLLESAA